MGALDRLASDFSVQLYGPTVGHGSFARVAAGMREGLAACGKLAGFTPIDTDVPCNSHAPCAVYVGPPRLVGAVPQWHGERWALLPPNSSWMPEGLLRNMWPHVTGFLVPSQWAAKVLRGYVTKLAPELGAREVSVWQHGVAADFVAMPAVLAETAAAYPRRFRVLHLASTRLGRKSTAELVEAWCSLFDGGRLGEAPSLRLVLDEPPNWPKHVAAWADRFLRPGDPNAAIRILDRQDVSAVGARLMYQAHHLVCQPSRGEGFGLVPLEARACGVPVVMTLCTGHAEHAYSSGGRVAAPGVHAVTSHALAPLDDGPGAMAPEVRAADIAETLALAYKHWPLLSEGAREAAPGVGEACSWSAVTERWLKEKSKP